MVSVMEGLTRSAEGAQSGTPGVPGSAASPKRPLVPGFLRVVTRNIDEGPVEEDYEVWTAALDEHHVAVDLHSLLEALPEEDAVNFAITGSSWPHLLMDHQEVGAAWAAGLRQRDHDVEALLRRVAWPNEGHSMGLWGELAPERSIEVVPVGEAALLWVTRHRRAGLLEHLLPEGVGGRIEARENPFSGAIEDHEEFLSAYECQDPAPAGWLLHRAMEQAHSLNLDEGQEHEPSLLALLTSLASDLTDIATAVRVADMDFEQWECSLARYLYDATGERVMTAHQAVAYYRAKVRPEEAVTAERAWASGRPDGAALRIVAGLV